MTTQPTESGWSYLKKMGNLHLAKEATDLEDHRAVMALNRAKLKQDYEKVLGANGLDKETIDGGADEMHVGDQTIHNHYHVPDQTPPAAEPLPVPGIGKGIVSAVPWIVTSLAIAYAASKGIPSSLDYVNEPVVNVEGGEQNGGE